MMSFLARKLPQGIHGKIIPFKIGQKYNLLIPEDVINVVKSIDLSPDELSEIKYFLDALKDSNVATSIEKYDIRPDGNGGFVVKVTNKIEFTMYIMSNYIRLSSVSCILNKEQILELQNKKNDEKTVLLDEVEKIQKPIIEETNQEKIHEELNELREEVNNLKNDLNEVKNKTQDYSGGISNEKDDEDVTKVDRDDGVESLWGKWEDFKHRKEFYKKLSKYYELDGIFPFQLLEMDERKKLERWETYIYKDGKSKPLIYTVPRETSGKDTVKFGDDNIIFDVKGGWSFDGEKYSTILENKKGNVVKTPKLYTRLNMSLDDVDNSIFIPVNYESIRNLEEN